MTDDPRKLVRDRLGEPTPDKLERTMSVGMGTDSSPAARTDPDWPVLDKAALHGLAGEVVRAIEPGSEGDPAGMVFTFLPMFGNEVGPSAFVRVGSVKHPPQLFSVLVGETSKSRKGTAWADVVHTFEAYDPEFVRERFVGGFGSGEVLVDVVNERRGDSGADVPRVIVNEPEFARVLAVASREGSILSMILREAWDGTRLAARSRKATVVADPPHMVSAIAHITLEELRRRLDDVEVGNGFANRFLFVAVRRLKLLPRPQLLDATDLGAAIGEAARRARGIGQVSFSETGGKAWDTVYRHVENAAPGGLYGAATSRASAHLVRLALCYALLDGTDQIGEVHVEAALAAWRYCDQSARLIFGDKLGDPVADRLFEAVLAAGDDGLDRTSQSELFQRHVSAGKLAAARAALLASGKCVEDERASAAGFGRVRTVLLAAK